MTVSSGSTGQTTTFLFTSGREMLRELEGMAWKHAIELRDNMGDDWVSRNKITYEILPGHSAIAQRVLIDLASDGLVEISEDRREVRKVAA